MDDILSAVCAYLLVFSVLCTPPPFFRCNLQQPTIRAAKKQTSTATTTATNSNLQCNFQRIVDEQ